MKTLTLVLLLIALAAFASGCATTANGYYRGTDANGGTVWVYR